jgi:hypothetical protein
VADEAYAKDFASESLLLLLLRSFPPQEKKAGSIADEATIAAAMGIEVEQVQKVEQNAPEEAEEIHNRIHGFMSSLFGG